VQQRERRSAQEHADILIVDDDDATRKTLCRVLNRTGLRSRESGIAPKRWSKLTTNTFTVALLNASLGRHNVSSVVRRLASRAQSFTRVARAGFALVSVAISPSHLTLSEPRLCSARACRSHQHQGHSTRCPRWDHCPIVAAVLRDSATADRPNCGAEHDVARVMHVVVKARCRDVGSDGVAEAGHLPTEVPLNHRSRRKGERRVAGRKCRIARVVGPFTADRVLLVLPWVLLR
jgi:CheY-like chemotaxis protein